MLHQKVKRKLEVDSPFATCSCTHVISDRTGTVEEVSMNNAASLIVVIVREY